MLLGLAALSLLITPGVISGAASIVARMPSHMEVPIIDTHAVDVQLTVSEMVISGDNLDKMLRKTSLNGMSS